MVEMKKLIFEARKRIDMAYEGSVRLQSACAVLAAALKDPEIGEGSAADVLRMMQSEAERLEDEISCVRGFAEELRRAAGD